MTTTALPSRAAPSGGLRAALRAKGLDRGILLGLPAIVVLVILFVYPCIYGIELSFQPQHGGFLASYRTFFTDPYLYGTIWATLRLALPVAALNVIAAAVAAYPLRRVSRSNRLLSTALIIPLSLGTVFVSDGLLTYLGPSGWLNHILRLLGITNSSIPLIHNYWGVFISLIINGFPFAFILSLSQLTGIDTTFEKAAAALGAGAWQRFRRIVLPMWLPGLGVTFCLVFILAFSVFPSAQLLGSPSGTTHVLSIAAYFAAYEQYDYSMASAITVIAAIVEGIVIGAVLYWRGRSYRGPVAVGKG